MRSIVFLTALLLSSLAFGRPPHGGPMPIDELTAALSLDDSQVARVEQIFSAQRERMQALRDLDRRERRAEMRRTRDEVHEQLQAVLSAEQMSKLDELHAERRARHRGGRDGDTGER